METENYDVVVVGGGPAGLSAALVLGRARRRVAVVDAGAPRNAPAAHMQGFLSRDGMPPAHLLEAGRAEVRAYGIELVDDEVVALADGFTLGLASGRSLTARRLLLATGASDVLPEIVGARERWGRDFLHCPYCHGWEVRDQPIGILGTGPGSVGHAQLLREWSTDVVFFSHHDVVSESERMALDARGIILVEGEVTALSIVDDALAAVELADGRSIPRATVFMRPTLRANVDGLVEALNLELDEGGFIAADATGMTSSAGVWVAGNAANPRAQVITAAGEGSAAAIAINADLVAEDVEDACLTAVQNETERND
jgi:thioredoxin reductase